MTERKVPEAYDGEFIRVVIGSTIHGLHVAGTDDLDLMGVRIESIEEAMGLHKPFEQFVWRTQPDNHPSGPGDVDLTVFSLRKYLQLATKGNPTVLNLLFVPPEQRFIDSSDAEMLRRLTPKIVSRQAGARYKGYLCSQRERLIGERGQKRTGYARREKYLSADGWDTKYGMHMVRLGLQGVELLSTGKITLPMAEPLRSQVYAIREGKLGVDEVVEWAEQLEAELDHLREHSDLPPEPDLEAVQRWMTRQYSGYWSMYDAWSMEDRKILRRA
jgi:uncharacterized protein